MVEILRKIIRKTKSSIPDLLKGIFVFSLAFSGFGFAIIFRFLNFDGTQIVTFSLLIEAAALLVCYFFLKMYLTRDEGSIEEISSSKKGL